MRRPELLIQSGSRSKYYKADRKMDISFRFVAVVTIALLGGCAKESEADRTGSAAMEKAQRDFEAGQYMSARNQIEASLRTNPRSSDAHLLAARIAEKMEDHQTALNEYVVADATGGGRSDGRYAAAELLLRMRAYNLANEWIARCLAERPRDRTMKAYRALLAERTGDSRRARADAEAVLSENTTDVVANAVLAEQALRRADPSQALIKIDIGLSKAPSDRNLLQLKAEAFLQQRQPDKAIESYRTLVAADPASAEYRAGLAELISQNGSVADGEQSLRAGIAVAPGSDNMRLQLVSFLARHRDQASAIRELRSAIQASPGTTVYDVALADLYAEQRDFDPAADILRAAIARTARGPATNAARLALARLQLARNDVAGAQAIVDELLKARPTDDQVIAVRGQVFLKQRNADAALRDFLAIAARQPANARIFAFLAEAYLLNDQVAEAVAAMKRGLSLSPTDVESLRRLVEVQSGVGDVAAASRSVEDFLSRNPDSIPARSMQVRLAIQGKDWISAETALFHFRSEAQSGQLNTQLTAEIREGQKRYSEAANLYQKLLLWKGRDTLDISAAQAFVRTAALAGQESEAIDVLTRLGSSVDTADRAAYELALATLHQGLGQEDTAAALVNSAIKRTPASPAPYLQKAGFLVQKNDFAGALTTLDSGRGAGAPAEPLLLMRAKLQTSNGQLADAIATYRELLRLDPNSAVVANELTNVLADQDPVEKNALREARDLLQRNALFKPLAVTDTLAWADYRLGELQRANDLLGKVRADLSPNPQIRFHYGAILIAVGETTKGEGLIKTTLADTYPGREEAGRLIRSQ
jgi:tetratricopeptide (TPR) repeat protein